MDSRPSDPFAPVQIGPLRLRNAVIKAATSEGRSPDGLVTDDLIDFHLEYVRGGVGMTTVAYCCVSPEGRSAPGQILMGAEALPGLTRLTAAVHAEGRRSPRSSATPVRWRRRRSPGCGRWRRAR